MAPADPRPHRPGPATATRSVVAVSAYASELRDPEATLDAILAVTSAAGVAATGSVSASDDDLREAIVAARGGRLILAGGDGALHFALNAAEGPIEIGLVPAGTANNVARSLGLPRDVPRAARRAVTAAVRPVDVLRVETPERVLYGIEAVSAGLQADARRRYESIDAGHLLEGTSAFASALGRYEPWAFELDLDGRRAFEGPAAELFLSNFPFFAYGFRIDPRGDVSDGVLDAILLEADSRHRVARLVLAAYRGTLARQQNVTVTPAREAVLAAPVPIVCDSEVLGTTTVAVRVERGRLTIAV